MEQMASSTTKNMLHEVYTSLSPYFTTQNLTEMPGYINPQHINDMVNIEMKRIQENCSRKEQQYVEEMLAENPITFERRTSTIVEKEINLPPEQQKLIRQRSEACRRSRFNNKIRKAKTKYRHKYMTQKLIQSSQMFNCIQDLIGQAESQLLGQGLSKDKLRQLRYSYGMDETMECVRDLQHILKTE
ncbi:protein sisterless A-like [Haematobia irritans]|uniref:protein sisterless A-like n=1 Tax=Haematobia irritans TaxID=7368 RepID=UPI003F507DAB